MSTPTGATSAIVIGASMAGLVTARVLSDHVDHVTILERDHLPEHPAYRRGVPQGRHAHALLGAGRQLLEDWFPGLTDELIAAGAVPVDTRDVVWHQAGAHRVPPALGDTTVSASRPLLEGGVRDRLLRQCPSVTISEGVTVDRLLVTNGGVTGVVSGGRELRADLVVDCTGRNTTSLGELAELGFPAPQTSRVGIDMAYRTRQLRRRSGDLPGSLAVLIGDPEDGHRMGVMVPIEDDRWIITVGGFHGDAAPTDPAGFEVFCRSLPSPEIADVLLGSEGFSRILTYSVPSSRRRHVERLDRTPPGFVVLGDAICSFNPIYGQGMSSAALQARALGRTIAAYGIHSPHLGRVFYGRAAKVVDVPWKMAATADFADPRTTGDRPAGTGLVNRYLAKVFLAAHTSPEVSLQATRVQNLLARPETLMTPRMVRRVLAAARRSPAVPARTDAVAWASEVEPQVPAPAEARATRQPAAERVLEMAGAGR